MSKITKLIIALCLVTNISFSQSDTTSSQNISDIFDRIAKSLKNFQLDTTDAPNDKITKKIIELRSLRGGFNINEAINFKIEEDKQKNQAPKEALEKLAIFFTSGNGKRWLDNATIWIYRQHFTYNELKQLVKFYKTSAGEKMATNFPVIMMQSLKAAEIIKEIFMQQQKK
ncbi:MAG: DUF2059 domain-containing protein [Chitinophagaceae bacterium]|nr:DUF2059 domain-containing protein [Chitinophagaceae bacterium]MCW5905407.1 DUF2059 domain-containing protein [Chitinophagaceae bacterium]